MIPITIIWAFLSAIPGAGFLVAGVNLWGFRKLGGSLFPLIFCWLNGIYDITFGVILMVAALRKSGENNLDLIVIWVVLYLLARVSSIGLALFLCGQADESLLREVLMKIKFL